MSKFNAAELFNNASAPAAQGSNAMKVVMLAISDIIPNPKNEAIYQIANLDLLQADIAENGLRQPLEVIPAEGGKYMLIGGERRWTACSSLLASGDKRFERLPCIVRQSQGEAKDLLALITANATARELTDWEKLAQHEALKQALETLKAQGEFKGRVRDTIQKMTGASSGALARLDAISKKCIPEVKAKIKSGEFSLGKAYEASKLFKVQQKEYAEKGYSYSLPEITKKDMEWLTGWLEDFAKDIFAGLDYLQVSNWNLKDVFADSPINELVYAPGGKLFRVQAPGGNGGCFEATQLDPKDEAEVIAHSYFETYKIYAAAKTKYYKQNSTATATAERKKECISTENQSGRDYPAGALPATQSLSDVPAASLGGGRAGSENVQDEQKRTDCKDCLCRECRNPDCGSAHCNGATCDGLIEDGECLDYMEDPHRKPGGWVKAVSSAGPWPERDGLCAVKTEQRGLNGYNVFWWDNQSKKWCFPEQVGGEWITVCTKVEMWFELPEVKEWI